MFYKTLLVFPSGQLMIDGQTLTYDDKYDRIIDNFRNPLIQNPIVMSNDQEIGRAINYYVMDEGMYFELELDNELLEIKYPVGILEDSQDSEGRSFANVLTKILLNDEPQYLNHQIKELNKELQMPNPANFQDQESWMKICIPAVMGEGKDQSQASAQCISMWQNKSGSTIQQPEKKSKIEILNSIKKLIEKNGYAISDEKILEMFGVIEEGKGYLNKLSKKLDSNNKTQEIQVFPRKKVFIEKYNEYMDFNDTFFDEMIANFHNPKLFKPFMDELHNLEEKFADIVDLVKKPEGLFAKIILNDKGKEAIKNNIYSYISPEWGDRTVTDGSTYKNVLCAITLTNIPALEGENPTLQDQIKLNKKGGNFMELSDKIKKLETDVEGLKKKNYKLQDDMPAIPPDVMNVITEAMQMISEAQAKIQEVTQQKEVIEEQKVIAEQSAMEFKEKFENVEAEKAKVEKDAFFENVVKDGQLEAGLVDDWKAQYDVSPEFVVKMLTKNPKQISLQKTSTTTLEKDKENIVNYNGKKYKLTTFDYKVMEQHGYDKTKPLELERYIKEVGDVEEVK